MGEKKNGVKMRSIIYVCFVAVLAVALYSCANIGRPDGGLRDENPPIFMKSNPAPNELNVSQKIGKLVVEFDEIVQLKDQLKKVVISPIQKEQPRVSALGKKVTVDFRDTLQANTTYTIDFADAIEDINESNPLDGFALSFTTGNEIDSLQISGMVLRARDLEPMQSTLVGVHKVLDDTAFTNIPLLRIARTNETGQFTVRNLKEGSYRVFALGDLDNNYKFSRNEDLAYLLDTIIPTAERYSSMDTTFKVTGQVDTIKAAMHTRFLPNDVLLSMFNEDFKSLYLKKHERVDSAKIHTLFSTKMDTLPIITPIKPEPSTKNWCRLERSERNDSLFHWITDKRLVRADTIVARIDYLHTDSLNNITWTTDTIQYVAKRARGKKKSQEAKKPKKEEANDSVVRPKSIFDSIPALPMNVDKNGALDINEYLSFTFKTPLDTIIQSGIHLFIKQDTLWLPLPDTCRITPKEPWDVRIFTMNFLGEPGEQYRLNIDSLCVRSIYGELNKPFEHPFSVKKEEEFANLEFTTTIAGTQAFVQLLNAQDKPVRQEPVAPDGSVYFNFVPPGTYYARIIIDANGNNLWDTGNYLEHIQPEEVYYYPKKLNLKKNWDVQQSWDVYGLPLNLQKPDEVKKNKPTSKNRKKNKKSKDEEEEEDLDEFSTGIGDPFYTGNKYEDTRRRR